LNLQQALALTVPHISAYALTVEAGTALESLIRKGKALPVDESQTVAHFEILLDILQENGFEHYEISNFCMPGHYARHNTSYWSGIPYLGLGPSAHSFNGMSRQWNKADLKGYLAEMTRGVIPFEKEVLSPVQHYNEYVMTSLRTQWGCDLKTVETRFGKPALENILKEAGPYLESGHLVVHQNTLFLTRKGLLLADRISADLFMDENSGSSLISA
jgi:oxygen-independent coproporphyrinogen-3 oxidase